MAVSALASGFVSSTATIATLGLALVAGFLTIWINLAVGIIGAGPSGITAAKNLLQARIRNFVIYEKNDQVGGNWVFSEEPGHSSVYETAHIITSRRLSASIVRSWNRRSASVTGRSTGRRSISTCSSRRRTCSWTGTSRT